MPSSWFDAITASPYTSPFASPNQSLSFAGSSSFGFDLSTGGGFDDEYQAALEEQLQYDYEFEPQLCVEEDDFQAHRAQVVIGSYNDVRGTTGQPFTQFWQRIHSYFETDRNRVFLSSAGVKYFYDVPPVFGEQSRGPFQFATAYVASRRCNCLPGSTCGRIPTPTHRYLFNRTISNAKPEVFRLDCWEAWQVRTDEIDKWHPRISVKERSDTSSLWQHSERFEGYLTVEIDGRCSKNTYWLDMRPGGKRFSRLLYAQQEESGGFSFFLCYGTSIKLKALTHPAYSLRWMPAEHRPCHRLVEYEFIHYACVQVPSTVPPWATKFAQDFFGEYAREVLEDLFDASCRGLLRLLL